MRSNAKNEFEKDFYKLMNNSVSGKTMENVRRYVDAKFAINDKQKNRLINNPNCKLHRTIDENMIIVESNRQTVHLNKPIYAGFSILELSKLHMMNFHYDFIKNKYGDNARLIFTDTDSLTYHIVTDDVYKDMYDNKHLFDFSDYPKDDPEIGQYYDISNKKVIGKFKDETFGKPIKEIVCLNSKCYSFITDDDVIKHTSKGVTKCVKNKYLHHNQYLNVLFSETVQKNVQRTFKSENHDVFSIETEKTSLCPYDNKRFILKNGIHTKAYGHYTNNY